jgi:hypothetical protein
MGIATVETMDQRTRMVFYTCYMVVGVAFCAGGLACSAAALRRVMSSRTLQGRPSITAVINTAVSASGVFVGPWRRGV